MPFLFRPPVVKNRTKILRKSQRDLFQRLEEYLAENQPKLMRLLETTWCGQIDSLTYGQLQEAYYQGDFSGELWQAWTEAYSTMVQEKMFPLWETSLALTVAQVADEFAISLSVPRDLGGEFYRQYGGNLITNLSQNQREAVRGTLWNLFQNENVSATEASYLLRPLIGLTTPQMTANARYYETIWQGLLKENPGMSQTKAKETARVLAEKYAAKQHRYRAQMIARTELSTFYNAGHDLSVSHAVGEGLLPEMDSIWSTSRNESTCPQCAAMEGERVPHGTAFSCGLKYPPIHPHCGCAVMYEPREEETTSPQPTAPKNDTEVKPTNQPTPMETPMETPTTTTPTTAPILPEISDPDLTNPQNNGKIEFVAGKTLAEAETFAKNKLGVPHVSYKGCDVATANAWNEGLTDSFNRFPELKKNFGFVGECHERNKLIKAEVVDYFTKQFVENNPSLPLTVLEPYITKKVNKTMRGYAVSKDTFAQSFKGLNVYSENYKGVTVNRDFGKNYDLFTRRLSDGVSHQWNPVGCDTIRATLDHEIGHQLDDLLNIRSAKVIQDLFDSRTQSQLTSDISEYSWHNKNFNKYGEMIAEAWAEYCNNPSPREIASTVGQYIEQEYQNKFG